MRVILIGLEKIDFPKLFSVFDIAKELTKDYKQWTENGAWEQCLKILGCKPNGLKVTFIIETISVASLIECGVIPTYMSEGIGIYSSSNWVQNVISLTDPSNSLELRQIGTEIYKQIEMYTRENFKPFRLIYNKDKTIMLEKIK